MRRTLHHHRSDLHRRLRTTPVIEFLFSLMNIVWSTDALSIIARLLASLLA
jgi:hypothetical protein